MLLAVCHSEQKGWEKVANLSTLSDLRKDEDNLIWAEADVNDLTSEDVGLIAEEFGLHPLAVDDAVNARQRPKVEQYEKHLFLVMHQLDEHDGQLEASQLACFIGDRYVLTLHDRAHRTIEEAKERWRHKVLRNRPSYLVHTLTDVVVDDYGTIADRLEDDIEHLEDIVLETPGARIQRQLYHLKQQLARLRRYATPSQRLLEHVLREGSEVPLSVETRTLFRDVHDHLLRIIDQMRNIDELAQAALDLTRAAQADELSDINKKLSAWAAIFAVGTLVAGVYGMNFELIPNEADLFGFWFAIALIVVASVILYSWFKTRRWL